MRFQTFVCEPHPSREGTPRLNNHEFIQQSAGIDLVDTIRLFAASQLISEFLDVGSSEFVRICRRKSPTEPVELSNDFPANDIEEAHATVPDSGGGSSWMS